ncbi:hypothetical protein P22_3379 [Propionispora sp. 2/2-37]|nr:hypothetical protein P22_3379 [Propionispora sp. 2/2-37]
MVEVILLDYHAILEQIDEKKAWLDSKRLFGKKACIIFQAGIEMK